MKAQTVCRRIVLAGEAGCRVVYCEDCQVAELEVGAVSLRLEKQAFDRLAAVLQDARDHLAKLKVAGEAETTVLEDGFTVRYGNVH